MKYIILLFAALFITVTGCRKDIHIEDSVFIPIGEDITTNLHGRVVDISGRSIEEAEVTVANKTIFTNGDGYFYIPNVIVPSDGFTINVRSQNNGKVLKRVIPHAETNTYEEIILDEDNSFFEFSNTVVISDSKNRVTITIPENSLVFENEMPYEGIYFARVIYYDPTQVTTLRTMPGNLQGIDKDGEKVTLGSYGMFDVEVTSENGESLFLARNKVAKVNMRVPALLSNNAPNEAPTWTLDNTSGLWLEEDQIASLSIDGDIAFYGFDITDLRYWNCDIKELNTDLSGTIRDNNGIPIENRLVQISFNSDGNEFFSRGENTNNLGIYKTRIPKDIPITLSVYDAHCNNIISTEEIGPFTDANNTKDVEIVLSDESYTITGLAVDCVSDTELGNATIFLYDYTGKVVINTQTNNDGSFAIHNTCFANGTTEGFSLGILNLDTGNIIVTNSFPYSDVNIDLGNVFPCEDIIESINVTSGFGDLSFDESSAFFSPDSLIISAEINNTSISLFATVSEEGINQIDYLQVRYSADQVLTCTSAYQHTYCNEAVTLNVTEINEEQKYITGIIEGVLYTGEIAEPDFTFSNDVLIEFSVLYQ
jgi:hypothetical protein